MTNGLTLAEQIKQEQGKLDALRTGYFGRKDIEAIESGNYTISPGGNVILSGDAGSWAPGGHSHKTKQEAAKIDSRLKELKDTQKLVENSGRTLEGLRTAAGGTITPENYRAATVTYDETKQEKSRDERRDYEQRLRNEASLEAEKIRAEGRLDTAEARMFEQQMRNADRALEREMRMFEMDEKNKGRKAELFQALFGLGTAFMI